MVDKKNSASILVVDDEEYNLFIIEEILAQDEHLITTVRNGLEAWKLLKAAPNKYDLVLLDRMMPVMNGMELLAKMKAEPALQNIPVILQTACAKHEEIIEGISSGAYYYVTKPYEEDMFLSVVRAAVLDCMRLKQLQSDVKDYPGSIALLERGLFHFSAIGECYALATLLANAYPEPEKAVIGLTELMMNALEYGLAGLDYDEKTRLIDRQVLEETVSERLVLPENKYKHVKVMLKRTATELILTIEDQGKGFDWRPYLNFEAKRATDNHGRGIATANLMSFDSIEYSNNGSKVTTKVMLK